MSKRNISTDDMTGFTALEKELFEENGFIGINCGDLIIKTESMPIVVLSMLKILKEVS